MQINVSSRLSAFNQLMLVFLISSHSQGKREPDTPSRQFPEAAGGFQLGENPAGWEPQVCLPQGPRPAGPGSVAAPGPAGASSRTAPNVLLFTYTTELILC